MPISPIVLQRRHAELGRIRLGDKGSKGQPQRLSRFRLTSPSERHIRDLATLYGGEAKPWKNGNRDEWEVYSDAQSIPVIVVKGGISQWMETWSGGGVVHRCDGVTNVLTDSLCDPDDPQHQAAKPTTRLSVMMRDLDAIGVWRLESHGFNAAAELPGLVELAQHVGDLVPANLTLHERVTIRDGKTSRFVVPGLDLQVTPGRLAQIVSGQQEPEKVITASQMDAIEQPRPDYAALAAYATTALEVGALWRQAQAAGHMNDALATALKERGEDLKSYEDAKVAAAPLLPGTGPDGEDDVNALWLQVSVEAGAKGWTTTDLMDAYTQKYGHGPSDATAGSMRDFLALVKAGEVEA